MPSAPTRGPRQRRRRRRSSLWEWRIGRPRILRLYAHLGLARVAIDRGQRGQAAAALDRIIATYPAFGPARTMRVQLASDAQALESETRGARAYTPPSDPLLDAVVAQSRMRDLLLKHAALAERGGDDAWREFLVRRALQFNPRDPNVLMEMAGMLQASGRFNEALDYLRQHQQVVPGDHHTLVEEGRVLSDLGRYDQAEAVLRKATRVRDAAAEYNLGAVLDRMGRSDEARAHYEAALAIDPYHARAMNNLGVLARSPRPGRRGHRHARALHSGGAGESPRPIRIWAAR